MKNETTIFDDETTSLAHISTYRTLIGELTRLKRQRKETQEVLLPFWLNMEKALMNQSIRAASQASFESLTHQNIPEKIDEVLAEPLYGKDIYTSVSRMESFIGVNINTFRYGLRLKERDVFGLSPAATGNFSMKHWISS